MNGHTAATRVLLLTNDAVGESMAGPAIRTVELARQLAADGARVVIGSPYGIDLDLGPIGTARFADRSDLEPLVAHCDVVVAMSGLLGAHRWIADASCAVVADAYDPTLFEVLEWFADADPAEQATRFADGLAQMTDALGFADLVLCASDRQRQLLIGLLVAAGRVNFATCASDPTLEKLVAVVPFGLSDQAPVAAGPLPLRGPDGPFAQDDIIVLWGGGIHQWLDPLTLVRAVAASPDQRVKAYVLGGAHPTPIVPQMPIADEARRLAADLGVLGGRVVFRDTWVPYGERAGYLLDADIGVSLHRAHVETTFAFRTRILDYLWAGLPIVCTAGDSFADLVRDEALGVVVAPGDVDGLVAAVAELADPDCYRRTRASISSTAKRFTWDRVAMPLVEYCRMPLRAADRPVGTSRVALPRTHADVRSRIAGRIRSVSPLGNRRR